MLDINKHVVISFTFEDKSTWGDGPWQDEPDKIVWIDPATDLDCMIHRGPLGALCGYVGVPPTHTHYGEDLPYKIENVGVDVHGGLTYAAPCDPQATEEHGLCHVPTAGRPDDVWWFGFDCSHAWDVMPAMAARERMLAATLPDWPEMPDVGPRVSYKTVDYVRAEVTSLAAQLRALA